MTNTSTSFTNDRQKVEIDLTKVLEQNEKFNIGSNDEIRNVSFGLYADEDLKAANGTVIPKNGLLEIITCDEKGKATFTTDLPIGSYYVKEISTDNHYILSDKKYPVVFEYAGQDVATVHISVNDGEPLGNEIIYGTINDIYSGGFYPYETLEEYWAWWSRHIYYNRYDTDAGKVYENLEQNKTSCTSVRICQTNILKRNSMPKRLCLRLLSMITLTARL